MTTPRLTTDWTDDDIQAFLGFAAKLGIRDLTVPVCVWANESDNRTTAHNSKGDASGLFQLMPHTATAMGYDTRDDPSLARFRKLTVTGQLQWAAKYYATYAGRIGTIARFYLSNFLPGLLDHGDDPSFVLCGADGPLEDAYRANKGFDTKNTGRIVVADLVAAANRATGRRTHELMSRIEAAARPIGHVCSATRGAPEDDGPAPKAIPFNNSNARDLLPYVRANLSRNDIPAPDYTPADVAAIAAYQAERGLAPDGEIGPATRYLLDGDRSAVDATVLWPASTVSERERVAHFGRIADALGASPRPVLLALRGIGAGASHTHAVSSRPALDDTMVLLTAGECFVFPGATHAYRRSVGGTLPMALVRPGAYKLVQGAVDHAVVLANTGSGDIPCYRDYNADGVFEADEIARSIAARAGSLDARGQAGEDGTFATGIWYHRNVDSIGCQTTSSSDLARVLDTVRAAHELPYVIVDAADAIRAATAARPELAVARRRLTSVGYEVSPQVTPTAQDKDNACWAAVTTMMLNWKQGTTLTIGDALNQLPTEFAGIYNADRGLLPDAKLRLLSALRLTAEAPQCYDAAGWEGLLRAYGPIWVTTSITTPDGRTFVHARVLAGIAGDGTPDATTLHLVNPAGGVGDMSTWQQFADQFEAEAAKEAQQPTPPSPTDPMQLRVQVVHW